MMLGLKKPITLQNRNCHQKQKVSVPLPPLPNGQFYYSRRRRDPVGGHRAVLVLSSPFIVLSFLRLLLETSRTGRSVKRAARSGAAWQRPSEGAGQRRGKALPEGSLRDLQWREETYRDRAPPWGWEICTGRAPPSCFRRREGRRGAVGVSNS